MQSIHVAMSVAASVGYDRSFDAQYVQFTLEIEKAGEN